MKMSFINFEQEKTCHTNFYPKKQDIVYLQHPDRSILRYLQTDFSRNSIRFFRNENFIILV